MPVMDYWLFVIIVPKSLLNAANYFKSDQAPCLNHHVNILNIHNTEYIK